MDIDLLLKLYTFLGSTLGFVLTYFQIRDRYPRVVIKAIQTIAELPVNRDSAGGMVPTKVPVIQVTLFNHGKVTIYPREIFLLVNRRERADPFFYGLKRTVSGQKFEPLIADRSLVMNVYGQALLADLPKGTQWTDRVSLQAVCIFENGQTFKSKRVVTTPTSLESHLPDLRSQSRWPNVEL